MTGRTVLIDNCILALGEILKAVPVERTVSFNGLPSVIQMCALQAKAPDDGWKKEQIECLPTIAKLAQQDVLDLYCTNEIQLENMQGTRFPALPIGDLFEALKLRDVDGAIDRSFFFTVPVRKNSKDEGLISFCKFLLKSGSGQKLLSSPAARKLPPMQIENLRQLDRFRAICRNLTEKQLPDAFLLWTAEVNGIEFFLTADKKFVNALKQSSKIELRSNPIFPNELLDTLGIKAENRCLSRQAAPITFTQVNLIEIPFVQSVEPIVVPG